MSNLSKYLLAAGISQRDFAEMIGVDKGTVSRIAAGKMTPRLHLAAKIEEVTGGAVKAISLVGSVDHPSAHGDQPRRVQGPAKRRA